MSDNRLNLLMDKAQRQPLTMIIPGRETQSGATPETIEQISLGISKEITSLEKNYAKSLGMPVLEKYILLAGLLQDYVIPQSMDYRLVKTFDMATYFYMFGEQPPIVQLTVSFSDGTLYLWNGDKMDVQQMDSAYQSIDILEMLKNKYFIYGKDGVGNKAYEPVPISFIFNRFFMRGYVVSVRAGGSSSRPGVADAGFTVVVKDYTTMPVKKWSEPGSASASGTGGTKGQTIPLPESYPEILASPPTNSEMLFVIESNNP